MSERERIEVWDCDCGIVNDVVDEECIVCEQPRQTIITPPTRDWKPEAPCHAMVEVFVKEIRGDKAVIFIGNEYPIFVPLSSIRPIGA